MTVLCSFPDRETDPGGKAIPGLCYEEVLALEGLAQGGDECAAHRKLPERPSH